MPLQPKQAHRAMLAGTHPFSGPPLPFCLPVIATRPIIFVSRRGITGLVKFIDPGNASRAPLGRLWVSFVTETPARKTFKSTKTSETSENGRFGLVGSLPEVRKPF
jgi:hypothetical protein